MDFYEYDSSLHSIPLFMNKVEFNCDGAFKNGSAVGVIRKDRVGLGCSVKTISALQVKLIAIREVYQIIGSQQLSSVIVESDSKIVVDLLSSFFNPRS